MVVCFLLLSVVVFLLIIIINHISSFSLSSSSSSHTLFLGSRCVSFKDYSMYYIIYNIIMNTKYKNFLMLLHTHDFKTSVSHLFSPLSLSFIKDYFICLFGLGLKGLDIRSHNINTSSVRVYIYYINRLNT